MHQQRRLARAGSGHDDPDLTDRQPGAIRDERAARGIGKALCAHFGADADVRGFVECATHEGWEEVVRGQANLCESAAPEWTDGATVPEEEP